jgi:DNA-binding NtrC family response regulator
LHSLETIERAAIKQTLQQSGGSRVRAAKALGIAASTLYEKLKKYSF